LAILLAKPFLPEEWVLKLEIEWVMMMVHLFLVL
jgi:hypothetical protein